jgi:hypothetical protein
MNEHYRFTFSEDYLIAANLRYRQQVAGRRWFFTLKWFLGAVLLALGALCAVFAARWLFVAFGAIAGSLLLGWPIDKWLMKRRLRKSPVWNDNVAFTFSGEGVYVTTRDSESKIAWSGFTKARRFRDGLLLFQGPQFYNWLPDAAATTPEAPTEVLRLVRENVREFRDV